MTGSDNPAARRPGAPDAPPSPVPAGVLVLDKPRGPSSMKAVAIVRGRVAEGLRRRDAAGATVPAGPPDPSAPGPGRGRRRRRPKVGHAGTLDPLAEGVLLVGVGAATRELGTLMDLEKAYRTVIDLSAFTSTDDSEGDREPVTVDVPPTEAAVRAAVEAFRGEHEQRPPAFSAVKVGGRRAYAMARGGDAPELPPRRVHVFLAQLERYDWPEAEVLLRSAKGFYVRSFARALGERLGTGGTCLSIRREAIGPFTADEATRLDDLPETIGEGDLLSLDRVRERLAAWRTG